LERLEYFHIHFGGRPLLLVLAAVALLVLARRLLASRVSTTRLTTVASSVVVVASLTALAGYTALAVWYARDAHYFDNAEPTMTAVGWLFHVGAPIYHPVDAPERYAHIYGPWAFIAHGLVLGLFGPSVVVSKSLGVTAGLSSLVLLFLALRTGIDARRALVMTGACALFLLLFRNYSFWTRPDPLQLFAACAMLLMVLLGRGMATGVAAGAAAGLLWGLKFTGPLYALPTLVLLQRRAGWKPVVAAVISAPVVAMMPFVAFSNVSLENYLAWVRMSGQTGLLLSTLRQNLEWAIFFAIPLLLSYYLAPPDQRPRGPEWRAVVIALSVAVSGVVIAAAKPGAGPYHLMPFLPVVLYLAAHPLRGASTRAGSDPLVPVAVIGLVVVCMAVALAQQAQLVTTIGQRATVDDAADIERFASGQAGVVEMGYGSTEALSFARPLLVFRNGSYFLDQPAVREQQLAGVELPAATIEALRACRVDYWLIPRGEEPFSGRNAYGAVLAKPLFPAAFRSAFHAMYRITATTTYFDAWRCHRGAGP
jgi:hypothetical protein